MGLYHSWSKILSSVFLIGTAYLHCGYSGNFEDEPFYSALGINPSAPTTRGNEFFLGFMNNNINIPSFYTASVALFITTEEVSSNFTVETRLPGVDGFVETSPGSGLFSLSEVATGGSFTVIHFQSGITVQDSTDRNKSVHVRATDPSHELTVYALNDELASTDGYMAISCTTYPTARDYRYFVFSAGFVDENFATRFSRFLIVPCEDDTQIMIDGSQLIESPFDMLPSVTDPLSTNAVQRVIYGRLLNQFETLMIESPNDLTGTIIISDKPISVFTGHQCGQVPTGIQTCDYLVEQIPPHATYGSLFFTAPFAARESGDIYRVGSVRDGAMVNVICTQEGNSVPSVTSFSINEGGFREVVTNRGPMREFCCIQSNQPITVMGYTVGHALDFIQFPGQPGILGDPSMVYIPPVVAYLNNYTITTAEELDTSFAGFISYVLPARIFDNSQADRDNFHINETSISPDSGYQPIYCSVNDSIEICAYGAYHEVGQGELTIQYGTGTEAFGLYTYGFTREQSFAYPTAFEMEPVGLAWIQGEDLVVLETAGTVIIPFRRFAGDIVRRSRAFASTRSSTVGGSLAGYDYTANDPAPEANSNLRWRSNRADPNNEFTVVILDDNVAEPVEYLEVVLTCDGNENCYIPRSVYRITIIDDQGQCEDLPQCEDITIDYNFERLPLRPFGTIATYNCTVGSMLNETPTKICINGTWINRNPGVVCQTICVLFAQPTYTFTENDVMGRVEVITTDPVPFDFQIRVTGGPSEQTGIVRSAEGVDETQTFPNSSTLVSVLFSFALTDDLIGGEDVETYVASLEIVGNSTVQLGSQSTTQVFVKDDDALIDVLFDQRSYFFRESNATGILKVVSDRPVPLSFDLRVMGGPSNNTGIIRSAAGISETKTFPAGSSSITFNFNLTDDNVGLEAVESYIASLQLVGSPLGIQTGVCLVETTVNVEDDEIVTAGFAESGFTVDEFDGFADLTVMLNTPAAQAVMVMVKTVQGTATENQDYTPQTVNLTIPAGETSVDFSVEILNDTLAGEEEETFQGVIESVFPKVTLTQRTSVVRILDDDGSHNNMYLVLSTSLGSLLILLLASIVITVTIIILVRRKLKEPNLYDIDEIYEDPDLIRYDRPPLPCRNIRVNDNQAYEKPFEMDENKAYTTGQAPGVNAESEIQRSSSENKDEIGPDIRESGVKSCSSGDDIRVSADLAYISRQAPGASESKVQNEGNQEDEMSPDIRESGERRGSSENDAESGVQECFSEDSQEQNPIAMIDDTSNSIHAPGGEQNTQNEYLTIIP